MTAAVMLYIYDLIIYYDQNMIKFEQTILYDKDNK